MTRYRRDPLDPKRITQTILRRWPEDFSLARPAGLVVGFSGGSDSLALALALARVRPALRVPVRLVHIDHRLRETSGREAETALVLAAAVGLPCEVRALVPGVAARHPGVGVEEAARRERFRALADALGPDDALVLAHHADDQAETVLMHLLRGAGVTGAAGMTALTQLAVPWWGGVGEPRIVPIWRPLLLTRRAELAALVAASGLTPVHDASNDNDAFTRNAIRHHAMPALEAIAPQAAAALARHAVVAHGEDAYLAGVAADARRRLERSCGGVLASGVAWIEIAIARRVIHAWLRDRGVAEPTFERVEAVRDLAWRADPVAALEVGSGLMAGWFDGTLRAGSLAALEDAAHRDAGLALPLAGRVTGIGATAQADDPAASATVRLPDRPVGEITVRAVQPDDALPGGERTREWLRRQRVSPWIRAQTLGVYDDRGLRAIPRIGDNDRNDTNGPTVVITWTWATRGARE